MSFTVWYMLYCLLAQKFRCLCILVSHLWSENHSVTFFPSCSILWWLITSPLVTTALGYVFLHRWSIHGLWPVSFPRLDNPLTRSAIPSLLRGRSLLWGNSFLWVVTLPVSHVVCGSLHRFLLHRRRTPLTKTTSAVTCSLQPTLSWDCHLLSPMVSTFQSSAVSKFKQWIQP